MERRRPPGIEEVYQITAPHFCAGIVISREVPHLVFDAAPILRYMIGWRSTEVGAYCRKRSWTWQRCPRRAARSAG